MTRRVWRWILGAVLACSLPACTHLGFGRGQGKSAPTDLQVAGKGPERPGDGAEESEPPGESRAASQAGAKSPYHPLRGPEPPGPPGHVRKAAFPQVEMPEPPPQRPPEPPPAVVEVKPPPELPRPPMAPPEPNDPLVSAFDCVLRERGPEAVGHLKRYEPTTQEVFLRAMALLADLNRKGLEKMTPEEVANVQDQLHGLLLTVRARAALAVEMCLCEEITGYRAYKPLPAGYQFLPPRGNRPGERVFIYAELRNLCSIKTGPHYLTRLSVSAKLTDGTGMVVWEKNLHDPSRPLLSPAPRTEHVQTYTFCVPPVPRPGKYRLTLNVRDDTCRPPRDAPSQPVDFVVAADGGE
jgi:hypothetical protein